MEILRKYGVGATFYFPLIDFGATDFESTPVSFAAGDTQISKDGGAFANTSNSPSHEGNGIYSLALTATEMQAAVIQVTLVDQTATKTWEDQALLIATYGNASAQHAFDLDTATQDVNVAQISGDSTAADNAEAFFDGTGYAGTNNVIPTVTDVTNEVSADVTKISGDATAADNLELDYDGTGLTRANSTIGTVTDVTNEVSADVTKISGDATAADNLEGSAETIVLGAAVAGTLSTTQMSTDLTEATDDHYIGRIVIWRTGVLAGQASDITDYDGAGKILTYTAITEAPGAGDDFVIV